MGWILRTVLVACALWRVVANADIVANADVDSELGIQARFFTEDSPTLSTDVTGALRYQLAYYKSWNDGDDSFEFVPWVIWDTEDSERRHGDIQDLAWIHVSDDYELRTGIRKVFWGVVESQHLVDVINQTDFAVNPNGEEKLGQPMVNLSMVRDWGIIDFFVLLGHRERIFPGENGRFRGSSVPMHWDDADYAHADEEKHIDFAVRWQHSYDDWEWAISHFSGTSRNPVMKAVDSLVPEEGGGWVEKTVEIVPLYTTVDQTGLEIQTIWNAWILKGEFISNSGFGDRYTAGTVGFEYTQVSIFESAMDFGWIMEYSADDRGDRAPTTAEHDVFLGGRLSLNDADSSEMVMGVNLDIETDEQFYVLEASQRMTDSIKLVLDVFVIVSSDSPPKAGEFNREYKTAVLSKDDYIQVEAVYYF